MSTRFGVVAVDDAASPGTATVLVTVEDASLQDASSTRVAETTLEAVRIDGGTSIPFSIEVGDVPVDAIVRVHVDFDGDGILAEGDLLTVQSIPVEVLGTDAASAGVVPVRVI
ncbi:hypothetical protein [Agromyces mangrovi Wang et al. 2018]|uniref:hypothetical protein n=1 Tax=Agromyces mangrovi TaxID=1858653 RepID=UPI0025727C9E|nr:hypothetical protein [Agromyces mangrovi]BDZ64359.1 hypothetical protein GCM10025877_12970 [Agromyces mangrovi]